MSSVCAFSVYLFCLNSTCYLFCFFFFQAEDGIRDYKVTGVQTCALPIYQSGTPSPHDSLPHYSEVIRSHYPPAKPFPSVSHLFTNPDGIQLLPGEGEDRKSVV